MRRGLAGFTRAAVALCLAACVSAPRDPLASGLSALHGGDLASALAWLDSVPLSHPGYAKARLEAAALERRLQRCHELLTQAHRLRADWRDQEALDAIEQALALWPGEVTAQQLAQATKARLQRLQEAGNPSVAGPVALAPLPATDAAPPRDARAASAAPLGEVEPAARGEVRPTDRIGQRLADLERPVADGALESVLSEMFLLHQEWPGEVRVRLRLARLLMQRGLLHYGRGNLELAVADWRRARGLDPDLPGLPYLLETALREAAVFGR